MKIYLNSFEAINQLHNNGFTQDFQLFGNDLFWIQQKIFIREHEFSIVESHEIIEPGSSLAEVMVFGIFSAIYHVKGILLDHYKHYTDFTPPVIIRKLGELSNAADKNSKMDYLFEKK